MPDEDEPDVPPEVSSVDPRKLVPRADPRTLTTERWFHAHRIEKIDLRSPKGRTHAATALATAADLVGRAAAVTGRDKVAAARLHALAAELRREAGHPGLCAENYLALATHYETGGEPAVALSYARKLEHVLPHVVDARLRMKAYYVCARIYLAHRSRGRGLPLATEGREIAVDAGDVDAMREGAALIRDLQALPKARKACGCGSRLRFTACCAIRERDPAELTVTAVRAPGDPPPSGGDAWWGRAMEGIDLLMSPPPASGETPNWALWSVEQGAHTLTVLPNWHGRAMAAAKEMAAYSNLHRSGTTGPSATVLHVTCALEAFVNAVVYFMKRSDRGRWRGLPLAEEVFGPDGEFQRLNCLSDRWKHLGYGLFGDGWLLGSRIPELERLTQIRNRLTHFHGHADAEVIAPSDGDNRLLVGLPGTVVLREGPAPWMDRLLTHTLADWAVDLGENLIGSFRAEWNAPLKGVGEHELIYVEREEGDNPINVRGPQPAHPPFS